MEKNGKEKQNKTKFKNSFSWCRDSQPNDTVYNDIWACNKTPQKAPGTVTKCLMTPCLKISGPATKHTIMASGTVTF
jgi:hypothetical protein